MVLPARGGALDLTRDQAYEAFLWIGVGCVVVIAVCALIEGRRRYGYRRGRRRVSALGPVVPEFSAPPGITPAMAASLMSRGGTAFAAQLVDLAVRDVIAIRDVGVRRDAFDVRHRKDLGGWNAPDFGLELVDPASATPSDTPFLVAIFGSMREGATQSMESLRRTHPVALRNYMVANDQHLVDERYVYPVRLRRYVQSSLSEVVPILAGVAGGMCTLAVLLNSTGFRLWVSAAILVTLLVAVVALIRTVRRDGYEVTEKGAVVVHHIEGIRRYLTLVDGDRLPSGQGPTTAGRVGSGTRAYGDDRPGSVVNLHERLLPYAIILGLVSSWVGALGRVNTHPLPPESTAALEGRSLVADSRDLSHAERWSRRPSVGA